MDSCDATLVIGTAQHGVPRVMPAVVLWLSDDAPKPTRRGCSHLLTDGGEEWEGRGDAGVVWGLLCLSYFPHGVVLQVLHGDPPEGAAPSS